mmetsp:Transcript_9509/g.20854  ORF Transcript_9509/g.20854 Transcript_9509/m.20854 type:complete len:886 (+) Transcript_9509:141-2798(+)
MRRFFIALSFLGYAAEVCLGQSCYQQPDCITNCASLTDVCSSLFCPTCAKPGYCDTTCGFCSSTTTSVAPVTTTTPPTTTTLDCAYSINSMPNTWCEAANEECSTCNPPSYSLCDVLFCPTCSKAGQCDGTCGFCTTTTVTSTTTTKTTTSTTKTTTSTTRTTTSTITSTTTTTTTTITTTSTTKTTTSTTRTESTTTTSKTTTTTVTTTTTTATWTGTSTTKTTTTKTITTTTTTTTIAGAPTVTSTTHTSTSTTKTYTGTTTTTKTGSTTTTTKTTTSTTRTTTTTMCYNTDYSATDSNGKTCSDYTTEMCALDMNDGDFIASSMCCKCGGGSTSCTNTDFGSLDASDRACAAYTSFDMCVENQTDADFNPYKMCCLCGGGSEFTSTTTTTVSTHMLTTEDEETTIAGISLWWFIIPLLALLLCLPWMFFCCRSFCCGKKKAADAECFYVADSVDAGAGAGGVGVGVADTYNEEHFDQRASDSRKHLKTATHSARIITDDSSETSASVYATTCELFKRVDLANDTVSLEVSKTEGGIIQNAANLFSCGGGTSQRARWDDQLKAMQGEWTRNGDSSFVARIHNGVANVPSLRTGYVEACPLTIMDNGRIGMEVDETQMFGQIVGDRLLWDNGDTWKRLGGRVMGGDSPFAGSGGAPGMGIGSRNNSHQKLLGGTSPGGGALSPVSPAGGRYAYGDGSGSHRVGYTTAAATSGGYYSSGSAAASGHRTAGSGGLLLPPEAMGPGRSGAQVYGRTQGGTVSPGGAGGAQYSAGGGGGGGQYATYNQGQGGSNSHAQGGSYHYQQQTRYGGSSGTYGASSPTSSQPYAATTPTHIPNSASSSPRKTPFRDNSRQGIDPNNITFHEVDVPSERMQGMPRHMHRGGFVP